MFGRLKDWWRVATRYDRCPKVFLSAIALERPASIGCEPQAWKKDWNRKRHLKGLYGKKGLVVTE